MLSDAFPALNKCCYLATADCYNFKPRLHKAIIGACVSSDGLVLKSCRRRILSCVYTLQNCKFL